MDKCPNILVKEAVDYLNTGVFIDDKWAPTLNVMFVDNNLLADVLEELRPAIDISAESLIIVIGKEYSLLRKRPVSIDKRYDRICSYIRTQLVMLISTRSLTLSIPDSKWENLVNIFLIAWYNACKSFILR